jgi:hypothetical protein
LRRASGYGLVTIELVYDPARGAVDLGTGINHLVVQVESLEGTLAGLAPQGIVAEPTGPPVGTDGPRCPSVDAVHRERKRRGLQRQLRGRLGHV